MTFKHEDTEDWTDGEAVKFRLGGAPRSMSYHDLATALDLGLVDDKDYVTELNDPVGVNFKTLYTRLAQPGQRPFVAGRTKASTLHLDNRILHHMLAKSYTPAGDSASTLTKRSMYFIQSIRQANHPLHLGSVVAKTVEKSASQLGTLHCTSLIIRLATYFQIPLQGFTELGGTSVFGEETIKNMHLLRVERGIKWIEGFPAPQIPAEDQPDVPTDEATEDAHPEDVDDADAPRPTTIEYGGISFTFPSQDYFTHQFQQLSLQNQNLLDHNLQFQQQYSDHQAEYHTRMAAYDARHDRTETQQGVTLAHIERERARSRRK
ncbi:unnamed protein product [Linum trigynum]|uniref:Uncharacterized protein n=1 Tax=Linum trigynum TaxID=586398 RepID=A0AAV2GL07_9ROSI